MIVLVFQSTGSGFLRIVQHEQLELASEFHVFLGAKSSQFRGSVSTILIWHHDATDSQHSCVVLRMIRSCHKIPIRIICRFTSFFLVSFVQQNTVPRKILNWLMVAIQPFRCWLLQLVD